MGAHDVVMVDGIVVSSLVVSPPLFGNVTGRRSSCSAVHCSVCVAICERRGPCAGRCLGLWGIVNDNDLLGETIFVEALPVGFPRSSSFS